MIIMLYLFLILLSLFRLGDSECRIRLKSYCTCHGFTLSYECRVMGSRFGTTVWTGSAFDCASGEISLLHFLYNSTLSQVRAHGECNKGLIVAKGLRIENDTYFISQLNISVSTNVIGKNIECIYDGNTHISEIIGTKNISISEYIQPPNISEEMDLAAREITFNWTKVAPECPSIDYNILASNCGSCPTTTNHTTATCTEVPTIDDVCVFVVQTLVCGNILGRLSNTIHVIELSNHYDDSNQTAYPCNNIGRSVFSGAIVSATLLGGIVSASSTILIIIIIQRRRGAKAKQGTPDRLYDAVIPRQSPQTESAVIDVRKNVAYGPIAPQCSSSCL